MDNFPFSEYLQPSKALLHVAVILALAWLLMGLSRRLIRLFRDYMNNHAASAEERRRIETLARVFRYLSTVVISLVAGMLVLSEIGISIAPILGAAGVVGIAVGFGAQSLIKDYFNGFFMLLENQIRQGDVVEVCGKTGVVEDITLRYVCLRDYEGSVHYIPNGLITTVTNKSRGYAYAVIDVSIAYSESIDVACEIMREVACQLRASEKFSAKILEDIDIAGVQDWANSAVILRCRFKTVALEQWGVRREFLRRIKDEFDARGIEIPYPHMDVTLYAGQDKQGNVPAFRLSQADDIG
ncbi:MAG: mechanosensitive ion channel protein MscS [Gallionellales bacterium RIFCSPLOWO2_02_FULL_57_47]|nr:MAG: mechanosensitive ion channel protein MscS [Gallionellales bacterium RIFCSPLOWO2_02_FULL_57_47]OGT07714.1 MAG: mechanosensitive ion channel protein MscS [Gallionellales bacterium RIFCSPHIGHO2_02_FULL_57_16]